MAWLREKQERGTLLGNVDILGFDVPDVNENVEQLAPVIVTGVAARVISFPDEFQGVARGVLIDNRDATNALLYRINTRAGPTKTISASGNASIIDQKVVLLDISGSTNFEVQATIKPREQMPLSGRDAI